jgi:hypothetical protein
MSAKHAQEMARSLVRRPRHAQHAVVMEKLLKQALAECSVWFLHALPVAVAAQ